MVVDSQSFERDVSSDDFVFLEEFLDLSRETYTDDREVFSQYDRELGSPSVHNFQLRHVLLEPLPDHSSPARMRRRVEAHVRNVRSLHLPARRELERLCQLFRLL